MNIEDYYNGDNKDIINSMIILNDLYNDKISFIEISINNIIFGIRINNKYYNIKNENDLKRLIEEYYNIKNLSDDKLHESFEKLVYDYMNYKNMFDEDKTKIYIDIYPLIDEFFEKYKKLKTLDCDTKKYFKGISNLNYNGLSEYLSKIIIDILDKE